MSEDAAPYGSPKSVPAAAISDHDLAHLRALVAGASPLPWTVDQPLSPADLELAVRAVNALPRLLDAAGELRKLETASR